MKGLVLSLSRMGGVPVSVFRYTGIGWHCDPPSVHRGPPPTPLPQASGKVPDVLLDVAKAEQAVSFILNRAKQIKTVCIVCAVTAVIGGELL